MVRARRNPIRVTTFWCGRPGIPFPLGPLIFVFPEHTRKSTVSERDIPARGPPLGPFIFVFPEHKHKSKGFERDIPARGPPLDFLMIFGWKEGQKKVKERSKKGQKKVKKTVFGLKTIQNNT